MMGLVPILQLSQPLLDIIVLFIALIFIWIIISIPVWLAGKAVTGGKATFGQAMGATLLGPIAYVFVFLVADFFLGAVIGPAAYILALILALIAWVWAYKSSFHTTWLRGLGIAILAVAILVVFTLLIGALFGVFLPVLLSPALQAF